MDAVTSSPRLVRFEAFEFDRHTLELRKHGLKIKLSGQPMEVLAMLLARPGELVAREELQHRLWPNDTVVEFEHSINAAVKTLRRALGDSADEPRYIETLARRGYRFIAPVEVIAATPVAAVPCNTCRRLTIGAFLAITLLLSSPLFDVKPRFASAHRDTFISDLRDR